MSNLGLYQKMTSLAKTVGGPGKLFFIVAVGGYAVIRTSEAGVKVVIKKIKKKNEQELNSIPKKIYVIKKKGVNNEKVEFNIGDKYRVLEIDGDAVLIEIIGQKNNPYFVSGEFLKKISDYNMGT